MSLPVASFTLIPADPAGAVVDAWELKGERFLSEAPEESAVRLGPAVANLLRSVWRQRQLVVLGLLLGLALGYVALPKVLGNTSSYQATVRMQVFKSPVDTILTLPPFFGGGEEETGASTDALKDITIAEAVLKKLRPQDSELTGPLLLERLGVSPVAGTPYVDVSYTDGNIRFASAVVEDYAERFAERRDATENQRYRRTVTRLRAFQGTNEQERAVTAKLADLEIAASTWLGTKVLSGPVVTTFGPPLSRSVTVALGLIFGLAIGAGAGLLIETAFRKVVAPSDAEEAADALIASVRKNGTRRTPLPVVDRPFSPAAEDYRRVATALERQGLGSDIKVLTIASADPGDGRTMLAANLAHSLARQGRAVVLVSSDLRRPEVEKLLGLGQGPGLAEALQDDPIPAIAMLVSINDHLLILPAGMPNKHPGELLASKRLPETIQTLRQMGVVILDSPPARLSADAIALSAVADATLVVARSGVTKMRSLRELTAGLRRDRVRQLGVVLVGTSSILRSRRADSYREQPEVEADELEPMAPPRPVPFAPKQVQRPPEGNGQHDAGVAELQERNRRAAE